MLVSQRVPIPSHLAEAKSLREMCAAADQLKRYDTPQALPVLGTLDRRAPSRASILVGFPFSTLLQAIVFLMVLAVVGLGWVVAYLAYGRLLAPIYQAQPGWLYVWLIIAALTAIWLIAYNKRARKILVVDDRRGDVKLSAIWRGLLWLARQITRLAMIITWLMGIAGLLLPAFYGLYVAWEWLQNLKPIVLGPYPPLQQYFGIEPFMRISPSIILAAVALIAVLMSIRIRWVLLMIFWATGAWAIYQSGTLDLVEMGFVLALALLWPIRFTDLLARVLARSYRRWRDRIEAVVLGWELRGSLSAAFAAHRARNRDRVNGDGRTAVCKADLAFFVQEQAGPVAFWWCPECQDDHSAYWGVKTVRGILDTAMTARYEQQEDVLRINLRAWQDARSPLASPPLDEVIVGKLGDSHEVEMFITQYHSVQAQRKWPSLTKVPCVLSPDTNLDEHARRQVQSNLRAA
jgi:hypothetical protein